MGTMAGDYWIVYGMVQKRQIYLRQGKINLSTKPWLIWNRNRIGTHPDNYGKCATRFLCEKDLFVASGTSAISGEATVVNRTANTYLKSASQVDCIDESNVLVASCTSDISLYMNVVNRKANTYLKSACQVDFNNMRVIF